MKTSLLYFLYRKEYLFNIIQAYRPRLAEFYGLSILLPGSSKLFGSKSLIASELEAT